MRLRRHVWRSIVVNGLVVVNLWLLCVLILLLLILAVPQPAKCWIPPNAPTRGIYEACWTAGELWG